MIGKGTFEQVSQTHYKVTRTNAIIGTEAVMILPITTDQLNRWQSGELIQNCMGHLTADQREFLVSGILPEDWDDLVPESRD